MRTRIESWYRRRLPDEVKRQSLGRFFDHAADAAFMEAQGLPLHDEHHWTASVESKCFHAASRGLTVVRSGIEHLHPQRVHRLHDAVRWKPTLQPRESGTNQPDALRQQPVGDAGNEFVLEWRWGPSAAGGAPARWQIRLRQQPIPPKTSEDAAGVPQGADQFEWKQPIAQAAPVAVHPGDPKPLNGIPTAGTFSISIRPLGPQTGCRTVDAGV